MVSFDGLARWLPRNAKQILEIGAADDQLAKNYARFNPDGAVETISTDTDDVASGTIFQKLNEITDQFDCIIQHQYFSSPKEIRSSFDGYSKSLKEGGTILLTNPNPFFFKSLELETAPELDQKRLNFIVRSSSMFQKNAATEFADTGLYVDRIFRHSEDIPSEVIAILRPLIAKFHLNERDFFNVLSTRFYGIVLTRKPVRKLLLQSRNLKPVGGVNDVRMTEPFEAMSTLPGVQVIEQVGNMSILPKRGNEDKIFFWHRPILTYPDSLDVIRRLREAGYLLITEFDDHHMVWPKIAENEFLNFVGSHAVQTSTEPLYDLFSQFNPDVALFPNQLRVMPEEPMKQSQDKTVIFFGALNRKDDWSPIMSGINAALKEATGDFEFEVVFDREFFDALETEKKRFTPHCNYPTYLARMGASDVCLMPLLDNLFNGMKSDLKLVEAAGHGAIPVASPTVYRRTKGHEDFSIICEKPEDFGAALKMLIEDAVHRQKLQRAARNYVRNNRLLSQHFMDRYDWYKSLLGRKQELDEALDKRLVDYVQKVKLIN